MDRVFNYDEKTHSVTDKIRKFFMPHSSRYLCYFIKLLMALCTAQYLFHTDSSATLNYI